MASRTGRRRGRGPRRAMSPPPPPRFSRGACFLLRGDSRAVWIFAQTAAGRVGQGLAAPAAQAHKAAVTTGAGGFFRCKVPVVGESIFVLPDRAQGSLP